MCNCNDACETEMCNLGDTSLFNNAIGHGANDTTGSGAILTIVVFVAAPLVPLLIHDCMTYDQCPCIIIVSNGSSLSPMLPQSPLDLVPSTFVGYLTFTSDIVTKFALTKAQSPAALRARLGFG